MTAIPEFTVTVHQRGRLRVVEVDGELDVLTAPRLGAAIDDEEAYDDLVLDLRQVPFMSSVGLGLLSSVHRRQQRRGRSVALAAIQPEIAHLLEITGLTEVLMIGDTVPAAIDLVRDTGTYYSE